MLNVILGFTFYILYKFIVFVIYILKYLYYYYELYISFYIKRYDFLIRILLLLLYIINLWYNPDIPINYMADMNNISNAGNVSSTNDVFSTDVSNIPNVSNTANVSNTSGSSVNNPHNFDQADFSPNWKRNRALEVLNKLISSNKEYRMSSGNLPLTKDEKEFITNLLLEDYPEKYCMRTITEGSHRGSLTIVNRLAGSKQKLEFNNSLTLRKGVLEEIRKSIEKHYPSE